MESKLRHLTVNQIRSNDLTQLQQQMIATFSMPEAREVRRMTKQAKPVERRHDLWSAD